MLIAPTASGPPPPDTYLHVIQVATPTFAPTQQLSPKWPTSFQGGVLPTTTPQMLPRWDDIPNPRLTPIVTPQYHMQWLGVSPKQTTTTIVQQQVEICPTNLPSGHTSVVEQLPSTWPMVGTSRPSFVMFQTSMKDHLQQAFQSPFKVLML
jgi:hypothetical protein